MPEANARAYRLTAIDLLRGLVIVIMALDHVRDFFHATAAMDPMSDPNVPPVLFATRWITHFCAPVFVLLAGVSAGLSTARKSPPELARFLFTRGLWLLFMDMTVISWAWTFTLGGLPQLGGSVMVALAVVAVIGTSMMLLAGLQFFGRKTALALGASIIAGHNLLDPIWPATAIFDRQWPIWAALHSQMSIAAGPFLLIFVYPLLPWLGVMLLGFGVSPVFEMEPARRDKFLTRAGWSLILGFILLRASGLYGDPNPWQVQPGGPVATVIDFLNVSKYPPSLLYVAMTLGPAALLCANAGRITGPVHDTLVMFGRVPFAFYVVHFYVIHALAIALGVWQGFPVSQMRTFAAFLPQGYGVSLPGVYLVWALVIAMLYPICRWVAAVKARRRDWWLSFV